MTKQLCVSQTLIKHIPGLTIGDASIEILYVSCLHFPCTIYLGGEGREGWGAAEGPTIISDINYQWSLGESKNSFLYSNGQYVVARTIGQGRCLIAC